MNALGEAREAGAAVAEFLRPRRPEAFAEAGRHFRRSCRVAVGAEMDRQRAGWFLGHRHPAYSLSMAKACGGRAPRLCADAQPCAHFLTLAQGGPSSHAGFRAGPCGPMVAYPSKENTDDPAPQFATRRARDIANVLHPYTDLKAHQENGPLVITRGKGVRVFDDQGKEYIESGGRPLVRLARLRQRAPGAGRRQPDAQAALLPRLHRPSRTSR